MTGTDHVRETESDRVYRQLKSQITSGMLNPGERIVVAQVSKDMGVSAMPVRSALKQLQQDGLVVVIPYAGAQVAKLDAKQFKELAEIRMILEPYATKLSVNVLTDHDFAELERLLNEMERCARELDALGYSDCNKAFHAYIYNHCGNQALRDLIFQVWDQSKITRGVYALQGERIKASLVEHREIVRLLREKKGDEAYAMMYRNNRGGLSAVLHRIEGNNEETL